MSNRRAVMVDIETLSTAPNAVVLSIGAVSFDLDQEVDPSHFLDDEGNFTNNVFYKVLSLEAQVHRHKEVETLKWWAKQGDAAKEVLTGGDRIHPKQALEEFIFFFKGARAKTLWCNGATFDHVILTNLCAEHGLTYPAMYYDQLDFRTLRFLNNNKKLDQSVNNSELVSHNAAWDAIKQTMYMSNVLQRLSLK